MMISLTKGLTEEEIKQLNSDFASSYHLRQRVIKLMNEKIESCQTAMGNLETYGDASWGMYQADRLGQIRAYKEIISLFS